MSATQNDPELPKISFGNMDDKTVWKLNITIPANAPSSESTDISKALDGIRLMVSKKGSGTNKEIFTNRVQNLYVIGGKDSSTTSKAILYPAGYWTVGAIYNLSDAAIPYVYIKETETYYKLTNNHTADANKKPGTSGGAGYWKKIDYKDAIYAENILAETATLGSSSGALMSSNYLCSQRGLDANSNRVNYSSIIAEEGSIFDTTEVMVGGEKIEVQKLNGNFRPSSYVNFYSGEVTCNKFSEHFDYFYPFNIQDGKIVYNNTYFMDLNKSHNVSILPRYVDTGYKNSAGNPIYNIRPGVVVLPKYNKDDITDGVHICVSYPRGVPSDGVVCGLYNVDIPGATIETSINKDEYYKSITGTTEEGYILVCADKDIFDENMYGETLTASSDSYYGPWEESSTRQSYIKSEYEDCFVWNGWKSKFILLTPGSELKLRSCIQYDINCTPVAIDEAFANSPDTDANGHGLTYIKDANGNNKGVIRKRIIGRQWVIENPEEFSPTPLHVNIDKNDHSSSSRLFTFKQSLKGYQMYGSVRHFDNLYHEIVHTTRPYTKEYYNKINCNLIGLASGKVNYRRGIFDINIYNVNNEDIQNNEYGTLPLVNATIYCKAIPKIHEFYGMDMRYIGAKQNFDVPSEFCNYINKMNFSTGVGKILDQHHVSIIDCPSFLSNPVYKYHDHYFQLLYPWRGNLNIEDQWYHKAGCPIGYPNVFGSWGEEYGEEMYSGGNYRHNWQYYWGYLGHMFPERLTTMDDEKTLMDSLKNTLSLNTPSSLLYKYDGSNLNMSQRFVYDIISPQSAVVYMYYVTKNYVENGSSPSKPTILLKESNTIVGDLGNISANTWTRRYNKFTSEYREEILNAVQEWKDNYKVSSSDGRCALWVCTCKKNNISGKFESTDWSEPKLLAVKNNDTYWANYSGNFSTYYELYGRLEDYVKERFGWKNWTEIGGNSRGMNMAIYYDSYEKTWKYDKTKNEWLGGEGLFESNLNGFISTNNSLDLYNAANDRWNIGGVNGNMNFYGGMLSSLYNEPNVDVYYMKLLQFGWGDGGKDTSKFFIDGPHLIGEIETEEHSIFFNEEMGTKINNKWYYYDNPLVVNLNISENYKECEDSGINKNLDNDLSPVYNSTFIEQWGLYKTINPGINMSDYKKARYLAYKK